MDISELLELVRTGWKFGSDMASENKERSMNDHEEKILEAITVLLTEYPADLLDELESAAKSGGVVAVRGRALGVPDGSLIYINPRAALWWSLVDVDS